MRRHRPRPRSPSASAPLAPRRAPAWRWPAPAWSGSRPPPGPWPWPGAPGPRTRPRAGTGDGPGARARAAWRSSGRRRSGSSRPCRPCPSAAAAPPPRPCLSSGSRSRPGHQSPPGHRRSLGRRPGDGPGRHRHPSRPDRAAAACGPGWHPPPPRPPASCSCARPGRAGPAGTWPSARGIPAGRTGRRSARGRQRTPRPSAPGHRVWSPSTIPSKGYPSCRSGRPVTSTVAVLGAREIPSHRRAPPRRSRPGDVHLLWSPSFDITTVVVTLRHRGRTGHAEAWLVSITTTPSRAPASSRAAAAPPPAAGPPRAPSSWPGTGRHR